MEIEESDQLVTIRQAASMLRVTTRTVDKMAKKGILHTIFKSSGKKKRRGRMFRMRDIAAVSELMSKKIDFKDTANIAMQAFVTAKNNERRVDDLFKMLGYHRPHLETDEQSVVGFYLEAEGLLEKFELEDENAVRGWAAKIYAIDELYLGLVQKHTGSDEPWRPFLNATLHMCANAPIELYAVSPTLQMAYSYLTVARDNLRTVSYHYCRDSLGRTVASNLFKKRTVPYEDLTVLLFPDQFVGGDSISSPTRCDELSLDDNHTSLPTRPE